MLSLVMAAAAYAQGTSAPAPRLSPTLYFSDSSAEFAARAALHARIDSIVRATQGADSNSLMRRLAEANQALVALQRYEAYLRVRTLENTGDRAAKDAYASLSNDESAVTAAMEQPVDRTFIRPKNRELSRFRSLKNLLPVSAEVGSSRTTGWAAIRLWEREYRTVGMRSAHGDGRAHSTTATAGSRVGRQLAMRRHERARRCAGACQPLTKCYRGHVRRADRRTKVSSLETLLRDQLCDALHRDEKTRIRRLLHTDIDEIRGAARAAPFDMESRPAAVM